MKTSDMDVRDMLSVLSVVGVEHRIGEVPGVESVTVNFAAGLATVRYDETRLNVTEIKSAVRQGEYEPSATAQGDAHDGHAAPGAPPASPAPATSRSSPDAAGAGPKGGGQPGAAAPTAGAAKPAPVPAPTTVDKPAPDAGAGAADTKKHDTAAMDKG